MAVESEEIVESGIRYFDQGRSGSPATDVCCKEGDGRPGEMVGTEGPEYMGGSSVGMSV